jgi:hypothetical protein
MTPVGGQYPGPRRWKQFVLVTFAGVLTGVVVLAGVAIAVLTSLGNAFSHIGERNHLKPIPISTTACPYVALMHAAANDFQAHEPLFGVMFDANGGIVPVARERAIVDRPLARLELAIAMSAPRFPAEVRTQLAITQHAAHQGRAELAHATDPFVLMSRSIDLVGTGQQAFGYASDLVGTQCGHRLGADPNISPYSAPVVTGSTTTTSRS